MSSGRTVEILRSAPFEVQSEQDDISYVAAARAQKFSQAFVR